MAAPKEGIGTTVTFAGVALANALLRSVSWNGAYGRETLDTSYMGTTVARTFIGETLYNAGELEMTFLYGGNVSFSLLNTAAIAGEAIAINLGADTAKTVNGTMTGVSFGAAVGELMEFTLTIKASGAIS